MTANDDALTALTAAVTANTTAVNAAVTAIGSGGSDDISAGVNAQAAAVEANTTALNNAVTPPAPPAAAADGTATPGAQTNEAGTVLPPQ